MFLRKYDDYEKYRAREHVHTYITESLSLSWFMVTRDPRVSISTTIPNESHPKYYDTYSTVGSEVDYVVLPMVKWSTNENEIIRKGIAAFKWNGMHLCWIIYLVRRFLMFVYTYVNIICNQIVVIEISCISVSLSYLWTLFKENGFTNDGLFFYFIVLFSDITYRFVNISFIMLCSAYLDYWFPIFEYISVYVEHITVNIKHCYSNLMNCVIHIYMYTNIQLQTYSLKI